jgi:hypothetical protein
VGGAITQVPQAPALAGIRNGGSFKAPLGRAAVRCAVNTCFRHLPPRFTFHVDTCPTSSTSPSSRSCLSLVSFRPPTFSHYTPLFPSRFPITHVASYRIVSSLHSLYIAHHPTLTSRHPKQSGPTHVSPCPPSPRLPSGPPVPSLALLPSDLVHRHRHRPSPQLTSTWTPKSTSTSMSRTTTTTRLGKWTNRREPKWRERKPG